MDIDKILKCASKFYRMAVSKEELPSDSDDLHTVLDNLEKLETFRARKKYAERNLKHLSSGSSRIVYLTDDGTIIKLAKNEKGLAQNRVESNPKMKSKFLNKAIKSARNNAWMECPHLKKIKEKQFKDMTGIDFKLFSNAIEYGLKDVAGTYRDKPSSFDEVKDSEIYKELIKVGKKFKLMPGDMARISSWGVLDNHPVLIDAGLTREVYDKFYEYES